jgi:membrane-associated protease RseP (regulator of RpoE activity)
MTLRKIILRQTGWFAIAICMAGCGAQLRPPTVSPALVESERQRQKEQVLRTYFERAAQMARVANMLRTRGAELCEDNVEPVLGVYWADKKMIPEEYWDASERVFGVGDDLRILSVMPGLPAEKAGLKPGDVVLAVDGKKIELGSSLYMRKSNADEARELLRKAGAQAVRLSVKRGSEIIDVEIKPISGCNIPVKLVIDDRVNAFADGKNIGIFTGMMRFMRDDDELAIVLGHEMAHITLDHVNRTRAPAMVGWALGLVLDAAAAVGGVNTGGIFSELGTRTGVAMFSKDYETEADYMGLYFAARAGFDTTKAPDFWRRMVAEHPGNIKTNFLSTHPSSPERAATIEATIREIKRKSADNLPLFPEKRDGGWSSKSSAPAAENNSRDYPE